MQLHLFKNYCFHLFGEQYPFYISAIYEVMYYVCTYSMSVNVNGIMYMYVNMHVEFAQWGIAQYIVNVHITCPLGHAFM